MKPADKMPTFDRTKINIEVYQNLQQWPRTGESLYEYIFPKMRVSFGWESGLPDQAFPPVPDSQFAGRLKQGFPLPNILQKFINENNAEAELSLTLTEYPFTFDHTGSGGILQPKSMGNSKPQCQYVDQLFLARLNYMFPDHFALFFVNRKYYSRLCRLPWLSDELDMVRLNTIKAKFQAAIMTSTEALRIILSSVGATEAVVKGTEKRIESPTSSMMSSDYYDDRPLMKAEPFPLATWAELTKAAFAAEKRHPGFLDFLKSENHKHLSAFFHQITKTLGLEAIGIVAPKLTSENNATTAPATATTATATEKPSSMASTLPSSTKPPISSSNNPPIAPAYTAATSAKPASQNTKNVLSSFKLEYMIKTTQKGNIKDYETSLEDLNSNQQLALINATDHIADPKQQSETLTYLLEKFKPKPKLQPPS